MEDRRQAIQREKQKHDFQPNQQGENDSEAKWRSFRPTLLRPTLLRPTLLRPTLLRPNLSELLKLVTFQQGNDKLL